MIIHLPNCDTSCSIPLRIEVFRFDSSIVEVELRIGESFDTAPKIRVNLAELKRALQAITPVF